MFSKKIMILFGILGMFAMVMIGCSDSVMDSNEKEGNGKLKMYMIDAPADYDEVNIEVIRVEVHSAGESEDAGWIVVNDVPQTYDLLQLRNGASVVLGEIDLPAGKYTQIRLILGEGSSVVVNGETHLLEIPSGTQTGLKLIHEFTIEPDNLYELTLDFDAAKSIHVTGNNKYMLKPTMRVVANVISGRISGRVLPVNADVLIWTVIGDDTISTVTDGTGYFKLMALPQADYDVHFTPGDTTYNEVVVEGVEVGPNEDENIGTIELTTD